MTMSDTGGDRAGILPAWLPVPRGRIGNLVLLGLLLATANTFGSSLAASRFLALQGADAIAIYYVVFAVVSIPVSVFFAGIIDNGSRVLLLQRFILAAIVLIAALIGASSGGGLIADYALYTGISVIEMLIYSVFQVALTDYMTAREMTRYSTRFSVALAGGGMAGGGLAAVLSSLVPPVVLMFGMPALLGLCLLHLTWLARRWQPAGEWEAQSEAGFIESLRSVGTIMRSFLIAFLLAIAVFFNIITQCVSEYLVFTIYTQNFPDEQALAGFLGLMNGLLNFIGMVVGLWLTDPLMRRAGIARMNLLFPAASGLSFVAILLSPILPVGMLAHIVYDGLAHNVDAPVMAVNYNAVPSRFVGRVRVFNDSFVYPLALAASGLLLWLVDEIAGFRGIVVLGIVLSGCFLLAGWGIGRRYVAGLVGMLREGAVDLDGKAKLAQEAQAIASRHADDLAALLRENDGAAASLAVGILAHAEIDAFLEPLSAVLSEHRDATVLALAQGGERHAAPLLRLWSDGTLRMRQGIGQYLAAIRHKLPALDGNDPVLNSLAEIAGLDHSSPDATRLAAIVAADAAVAAAILPVTAVRRLPALVPALIAIIRHHPALATMAVNQLAVLSENPSDRPVLPAGLIDQTLAAPHPDMRQAGWRLAARQGWPTERLIAGFEDPDERVRKVVTEFVAGHADGKAAALPILNSLSPYARLAAIEVLGRAQETDALFAYLNNKAFPRISLYRSWRQALPDDSAAWAVIARIAMAEADQAAIEEVLATLSALGHKQTVTYVRRFLSASDERLRSRAIETITALDQRNLIAPLMPLLDAETADSGPKPPLADVLTGMIRAESPWLRRAAAAAPAIPGFPPSSLTETDMPQPETNLLERLMFLRRVPIFESCSLDDLHALQSVLTRSDYLAGERIVTAGEQGEELFILFEGAVRVSIGGGADLIEFAQLKPGAMFGEMALFGQGERSADVTALVNSACLVLERSHFEDLTRQRPGILLQICRVFGNRLREANDRWRNRAAS